MKKLRIFALLLLAVPLFAVKIIDIKTHTDKNDSVNITLSFDGVFKGEIIEKRDKEAILFTLNGVTYDKKQTKSINSSLIGEMFISPDKGKTSIMLEVKDNVRVNAEKINQNMGIMIRALSQNAQGAGLNLAALTRQNSQQSPHFEGYDYSNYALILGLLLLLLTLFWWLNRSLRKGRFNGREFRILFQRPLDKNNKFAIIEFDSKRYTMILGTSNILLDSIDLNEQSENQALNSSANLKGNADLSSGANANSANSAALKAENLGTNTPKTPRQKDSKKQKSFESFFEENKQRLQNLIKTKLQG